MSADRLRQHMDSLGTRGVFELYARWTLYASRLLARTNKGLAVEAIEAVNDAYRRVADGAKGHVCPDDVNVEVFMAQKIKSAVSRLTMRQRRSLARNVLFDDQSATHVDNCEVESSSYTEMVSHGVQQIMDSLPATRLGPWAKEYVEAFPDIIETTSSVAEVAERLKVSPKLMAKHRQRLFNSLGYDPTTGKIDTGKLSNSE